MPIPVAVKWPILLAVVLLCIFSSVGKVLALSFTDIPNPRIEWGCWIGGIRQIETKSRRPISDGRVIPNASSNAEHVFHRLDRIVINRASPYISGEYVSFFKSCRAREYGVTTLDGGESIASSIFSESLNHFTSGAFLRRKPKQFEMVNSVERGSRSDILNLDAYTDRLRLFRRFVKNNRTARNWGNPRSLLALQSLVRFIQSAPLQVSNTSRYCQQHQRKILIELLFACFAFLCLSGSFGLVYYGSKCGNGIGGFLVGTGVIFAAVGAAFMAKAFQENEARNTYDKYNSCESNIVVPFHVSASSKPDLIPAYCNPRFPPTLRHPVPRLQVRPETT